MKEFEIKSKIHSFEEINNFLQSLSFEKERRIIDVYYDTPNYKFFELGVFIRIRNDKKLDVKYNNNLVDISHLSCTEYSFDYPLNLQNSQYLSEFFTEIGLLNNNQITNNLFRNFDLNTFVTIDKMRQTFISEDIEVAIDNVKDLGNFIEIEARNSATIFVMETAKKLGLDNLLIGYVELYLRKYAFETYLKGRYLLDEDKNK